MTRSYTPLVDTTDTQPQRVRVNWRHAGGKKPANTVYVGRPSKWGNPFRIGEPLGNHFPGLEGTVRDAAHAVELFTRHTKPNGLYPLDPGTVAHELRGRDLACWCPVGQPCHADVLLHRANQPEVER